MFKFSCSVEECFELLALISIFSYIHRLQVFIVVQKVRLTAEFVELYNRLQGD